MEQQLILYLAEYFRTAISNAPSDAPIKWIGKVYEELPTLFQDTNMDFLSFEVERVQYTPLDYDMIQSVTSISIYLHQYNKKWYPTADWNFNSVYVKKKAKEMLTWRSSCPVDPYSIYNLIYDLVNPSKCKSWNVQDGNCVLSNKLFIDSIDYWVSQAVFEAWNYVCRINLTSFNWAVKTIWI